MIGRTLEHYRIESKLGAGGMGVVYKAHDARLDRPVAIKILRPERPAEPDVIQRFVREAKAASALNHPDIVTFHDIRSDAGTDFSVMEWIDGRTLAELIPPTGLRAGQALQYAVQIADALAAAHRAGILHRDLKPSNVIFAMRWNVVIGGQRFSKSFLGAIINYLTRGTLAVAAPKARPGDPRDGVVAHLQRATGPTYWSSHESTSFTTAVLLTITS